jgi:excisionase family DNA binding protein
MRDILIDVALTPGEVARLMKVDPKTVSRWVGDGRIPGWQTPGGHVRINRTTLEQYIINIGAERGDLNNVDKETDVKTITHNVVRQRQREMSTY